MLVRIRRLSPLFPILLASLSCGCGGGPPSAEVEKQITAAVITAQPEVFESGPDGAEVVGIALAGWEKDERMAATNPNPKAPVPYASEWTAKLRFKEPIGFVIVQIDGTRVVKVIADKGSEVEFKGNAMAIQFGDKWEVSAFANNPSEGGPWKALLDTAGSPTFGYEAYDNGNRTFAARGAALQPLSRLKPCVVEGSSEEKAMYAASQERQRKAQEVAQAQQLRRQQEAEARRNQEQAEATEKQRLRDEDQQRRQAEAQEKQRLAQEEAKQKADAARKTRLLGVLKPFQSPTGAIVTSDAGAAMGAVIVEARIDEETFKVSGRGVDLREMPFREFTFEGSVDERGAFSYKPSLVDDPIAFSLSGEKLVSRAGLSIAAQSEAERAQSDALVTLGKRLQTASPVEIKVEVLDAAACKAREVPLKLNRLKGVVLYRAKNSPAVAPLFAGDLAAGKAYTWKNREVLALRLDDTAKGTGLYIRGAGAATENLNVIINGVHTALIPAIPKLGSAILTFPPDLEILDLRLEAIGAAQSRTIGLLP